MWVLECSLQILMLCSSMYISCEEISSQSLDTKHMKDLLLALNQNWRTHIFTFLTSSSQEEAWHLTKHLRNLKMDLQESSIQLHIMQERQKMYFAKADRRIAFVLKYSEGIQKYLIQQLVNETTKGHQLIIEKDTDRNLSEDLQDIHIPIDSQVYTVEFQTFNNKSELQEIYQLQNNGFFLMNAVGSKSYNQTWKILGGNIWERRRNLTGFVMQFGDVMYNGANVQATAETFLNIGTPFFVKNLWHILMKKMNFTAIVHPGGGRGLGTKGPNGTYDGVLGMLISNDVSVLGTWLLMTPERIELIDFSNPLFSVGHGLFIREPQSFYSWRSFVDVFSKMLWISTILTVIAIGLSLHCISILAARIRKENTTQDNAMIQILRVLGNVCSQGLEYVSTSWSGRISCLTSILFGLLICEAYKSMLMSLLTTKRVEVPFNFLEEIIEKKTHDLIVFKDGFAHEAFMTAKEGVLKDTWEVLLKEKPENLIVIRGTMFQKVCKEDVVAIMPIGWKYVIQKECRCVTLKGQYIFSSGAIPIRKSFPFRQLFSYYFTKLQESGIQQYWFKKGQQTTESSIQSPTLPISLDHVYPAFLLYAVFILVPILLLLLEIAYFRYYQHSKELGKENEILSNC